MNNHNPTPYSSHYREPRVKAGMHFGLSGHVTMIRRKASDESILEIREFDNLITDSGLDKWGTGQVINRCQVGSGNSTPAANQTGLQALVATTSTSRTVSAPFNAFTYDATNRFQTYTCCYRFDTGVAAGTLAEVAMGWSDAPAGIWCRALILDGSNNPTTITVLSDEILDVYYTIKIQFPAADNTGTVTMDGTTYTWTGRPSMISTPANTFSALFSYALLGPTEAVNTSSGSRSQATGFTGTIGTVTAGPSGSNLGTFSYYKSPAYVAGSFSRLFTCIAYIDDSVGSIASTQVLLRPTYGSTQFYWQFGFSPAIVKTTSFVLNMDLTISWGRG